MSGPRTVRGLPVEKFFQQRVDSGEVASPCGLVEAEEQARHELLHALSELGREPLLLVQNLTLARCTGRGTATRSA